MVHPQVYSVLTGIFLIGDDVEFDSDEGQQKLAVDSAKIVNLVVKTRQSTSDDLARVKNYLLKRYGKASTDNNNKSDDKEEHKNDEQEHE